MKQLLLSAAVTLSLVQASAFEADLDGTKFNIDTVYCQVVGPGITRSQLSLTAPGRSVSVYTSTLSRSAGATPGVVEPRVIIGKDQCRTAESLTSMAARHTGGDTQYLTGINGDFFITSSFAQNHEFGNNILGYPNMACVIDGKIAAPDMIDIVSRENALIIGSEGWWIDATDFKYRVLSNDGEIKVDATAVNYPRRDGEMVVYNSYMGSATNTAANGREIVLKMADGYHRIRARCSFPLPQQPPASGLRACRPPALLPRSLFPHRPREPLLCWRLSKGYLSAAQCR